MHYKIRNKFSNSKEKERQPYSPKFIFYILEKYVFNSSLLALLYKQSELFFYRRENGLWKSKSDQTSWITIYWSAKVDYSFGL
jgi:hypothetical protein